jgi:tetratricopeptide (TPR) repeat protein
VLKYRPLADYYLGILRMQQGRFDEAIEMNRRAHASFRRDRQALALRLGDGDLALIYMAQGDYRKARAILERVAREDVKILDTNAAGLTFNNLAVSCAKLRDLRGARDAYLRALGFHAAGNRRHLLAGTYANLGMTLSKLGEIEPAFAALDRAIELAEEIKSAEIGLRARTAAIEAVLRHGTRLGLIPVLTTRCDEIVRKSASEVSKDALQEYSTALAEIVSAQVQKGLRERRAAKTETVGSRSGQSALEKLADRIDGSRYREMLADRLGEGLRRRFAPPPGELCDFLMLFTGDYLRFHDYVSEFWLTVSRGKLHLRELCDRRILDIDGNRKAAKYSLAFHRPS